VVLRPGVRLTAAELIVFSQGVVSRTKVPREIAFVTSLPIGPSGKVHKRTLRQWLIEGSLTTEKPVRA
jgi:long-chain acyl-CoA synthetase